MHKNIKDLYDLNSILEVYDNLEEKKGIEQLIDNVKLKIFNDDINEKNVLEFKDAVRKITSAYAVMKDKFSRIFRDDGDRYFEHLRAVANIVIELENSSVEKVLIALYHDAIEDVNASYEVISYLTDNPKVALAVEVISKRPWTDYSDDKTEGKRLRNEEYFEHLSSYKNMKSYVLELLEFKNLELSDIELDELIKNVFDVKFADRIHNLSTQWDEKNLEKVERKVEETKKYFLNIAYEINPEAYKKLKTLILELELKLVKFSLQVGKILEK